MIYLFGYQDIKNLAANRQARSLAKFEAREKMVIDSYHRHQPEEEAEVIELAFGTYCDSEPIGA